MRIDQFLKNARIIKRRTIAKQACQSGRVTINGKIVKPGDEVSVGDIIEIEFGSNKPRCRIKEILNTQDKNAQERMIEWIEEDEKTDGEEDR